VRVSPQRKEQEDDRPRHVHRRLQPALYTGGVREFEIEAKNLRGVIREMDKLYPGLGHHLEEETTVAIDGQIHETAYFQPVRPGCEIFFIPKLEGG
jgi:molybdopterin synthase sulfur carrier subunit